MKLISRFCVKRMCVRDKLSQIQNYTGRPTPMGAADGSDVVASACGQEDAATLDAVTYGTGA